MANRKALDIEGLGGVVAEKLVERGLVKDPLDVFVLDLEGLGNLNLGTDEEPRTFGVKNASKILEALKKAKNYPLDRWLHALGIPNVGYVAAHELSCLYPDLESVAETSNLELLVELLEKITQAQALNPESKNNYVPSRRERLEKEEQRKALKNFSDELEIKNDPSSDAEVKRIKIHRSKLLQEIHDLKIKEQDESAEPIEKHKKANAEIRNLARILNERGMPVIIYDAPRDVKTHIDPLISIRSEIEPEVARSILRFFCSNDGKNVVQRLRAFGIFPKGKKGSLSSLGVQGVLSGKAFVLTGTLPTLSRQMAEEMIQAAGGKCTGSVSKNTDYLLAGESAGSKLDKAKELGITILNEKQFLEMMKECAESAEESSEKSSIKKDLFES